MIIKILLSCLLALSAANAVAGNMYIYKDKEGKTLLANSEKSKRSKDTYIQVVQPYNQTTNDSMQYGLKFEVPYGYRLPTKDDNTNDWKRFDGPNHLKADFNGDGIEDEAYLLPKKGSNGGFGVFVSINKSKTAIQNGRTFQMFKLIGIDDMSPQSFAIELAEPSEEVWETACGKGYWKCEAGEPVAVKINIPSIVFCYIESSCNIYMWETAKLNFKEIVISD